MFVFCLILFLLLATMLIVDGIVIFGWYKLHDLTTKYRDGVDQIDKAIDELKESLDELSNELDRFSKD